MKATSDRIKERVMQRSVPELLVRKFLTEYGYTHGPVIAAAIVQDILATLAQCYPERVPPKTVVWLAVRRDCQGRHKGIGVNDLTPVHLRIVTEEELELLRAPALRRQRKARKRFNQVRFARWCQEAYQQGGVLTLLELSVLSGLSEHYIGKLIREYEAEAGTILPTRGTVHDMGPSVTHKAEVIRRWLRKESPAQIARTLDHSQEAVDRYLADFQKVRLLAQKFPVSELSVLSGLSASVVRQYIALLQEYEPELQLYGSEESEIVEEGSLPTSSSKNKLSEFKPQCAALGTEYGTQAICRQDLVQKPEEGLSVGH
jgi:hypothetical protein